MSQYKILCVDDERIVLSTLSQQLLDGIEKPVGVEVAQSASEALEVVQELQQSKNELAMVISDQLMPGMKGDEFLAKVHQVFPKSVKILLTGQSEIQAVQNAINYANLYRFISKPWEKLDILMAVKEGLNLYEKTKTLEVQNQVLSNLHENTQTLNKISSVNESLMFIVEVANQFLNPCGQVLLSQGNKFEIYNKGFEHVKEREIWNHFDFGSDDFMLFRKNKDYVWIELAQYGLRTLLRLKLSDELTWFIGFVKDPRPSDLNWLKLLLESVKIQLERCLLIESLENKVKERTFEIQKQAKVIQEQHNDILDSIQYAKRIQTAILPEIQVPLKHFIWYSPKDIISGDFYWSENINEDYYFAIGDCTGHGVPGAMLSTLSVSLLNQIIADHDKIQKRKKTKSLSPADVLSSLSALFQQRLQKNEQYHGRDGLEIGAFRWSSENFLLQFAGANMELWIISDNQIVELEGDKNPIEGNGATANHDYQNHEYQCKKGDVILLFSDGLVDQSGSVQNKKYGYKRLRDFLIRKKQDKQVNWSAEIQKEIQEWRQDKPQTDDIIAAFWQV